ncbi:HAD family hydrolase [uncultured Tenacibaculum sp.]|uniref:HAD family hydrolase n=1 Tax=uncultured Tenacibaculum sp. TaxID=174713 RepID=UPI00261676A5|nr:HAD family hydrolase [uncultured Tenacibaculum sp.]
MKNIKVIVFDLYNTLVEIRNNNKFFLQLYKESLNGFNIDISLYLELVMTKNEEELFEVLPDEFYELFRKYEYVLNEEVNSIFIYDEVLNSLQELQKKHRLFLISNLAFPYKKPAYNLGLYSYFETMIFSCDFGHMKPDEKIFREIEKRTKVESEEVLMIGDSLKSDIKGAEKMGWKSIQIDRKTNSNNLKAIKDLTQLNKLLITSI